MSRARESGALVDEVVERAIRVAALADVFVGWDVGVEAAGVVRCECVAYGQAEGGGGGMAGWGGFVLRTCLP